MKRFEHDVTHYTPKDLGDASDFVCSEDGVCAQEKPPDGSISKLRELLDRHGAQGWELVELAFGKGGAIAFWKREIDTAGGY